MTRPYRRSPLAAAKLQERAAKRIASWAPMIELYRSGYTLEEIGQKHGCSRQYIQQCFKKAGITKVDGGEQVRATKNRKAFAEARDARLQQRWGCSYEQYQQILKHPDKPTIAFASQKNTARVRGIAWELTLWQWWQIWEQSGRWDDRGRGYGYCMCRLGDVGPYAVDNVRIASGYDNIQEYHAYRRARATLQKPAGAAA